MCIKTERALCLMQVACLVLIITITSMVLISIQPFAFRKIFVLVATLLCLSSAICFTDPLFMSSRSNPSGRELSRFKNEPSQPSCLSLINRPRGPIRG
jgi:hypothetical protein